MCNTYDIWFYSYSTACVVHKPNHPILRITHSRYAIKCRTFVLRTGNNSGIYFIWILLVPLTLSSTTDTADFSYFINNKTKLYDGAGRRRWRSLVSASKRFTKFVDLKRFLYLLSCVFFFFMNQYHCTFVYLNALYKPNQIKLPLRVSTNTTDLNFYNGIKCSEVLLRPC